ncbi:MAG: DUF1254 domain-containing protein [Parachlamydiales bacterium]|jgi:DNA sulfur modification protein DndE
MKKTIIFSSFLLAGIMFLSSCSKSNKIPSKNEIENIAVDGYIYGYPLVTIEMTRQVLTNTNSATNGKAPMGQFNHLRNFPNSSFKDITAPNADTLYSIAFLDLSKGSYVLHIPNMEDRYFLMSMLSSWSNVFETLGTRLGNTKESDYLITGPNFTGTVPNDLQEIRSPTNLIWIIGRTYCLGTKEDYKKVYEIQNQYKLIPLSSYGKNYLPPKGIINKNIDMKTSIRDQVNNMNIEKYFNMLSILMKNNPPSAKDCAIMAKLAKIGIIPGQKFDLKKLSPEISAAIQNTANLAKQKILDYEKKSTKLINGWKVSSPTGEYGTNYLQRALIAMIGLGANLPQDAIYPMTDVDSNGLSLNGKNKYVIHFPKDHLPPVKGFWSLTMYNDQYFFIKNSLNRYSIGQKNNFKYNSDGSLDLYIQNIFPEKEKESNWLPAPEGNFVLMFRFYSPDNSIIDGSWQIPSVDIVQ